MWDIIILSGSVGWSKKNIYTFWYITSAVGSVVFHPSWWCHGIGLKNVCAFCYGFFHFLETQNQPNWFMLILRAVTNCFPLIETNFHVLDQTFSLESCTLCFIIYRSIWKKMCLIFWYFSLLSWAKSNVLKSEMTISFICKSNLKGTVLHSTQVPYE